MCVVIVCVHVCVWGPALFVCVLREVCASVCFCVSGVMYECVFYGVLWLVCVCRMICGLTCVCGWVCFSVLGFVCAHMVVCVFWRYVDFLWCEVCVCRVCVCVCVCALASVYFQD